jgi:soluble cytochrome b562
LLIRQEQPSKEFTMGMRVGGSSAAWASQQNNTIGNWQQKQQNVKDLFSALKAGDLEGAKKAIASLDGTAAGAANASGPFAAISKALQSGDLQGAQAAAQAMPHRKHHHHDASPTATASASTSASTTAAVGTNINITA